MCAVRQAWQQPRMQQWGPTQASRAAALGEALLAEMGGLKVAAAEAAPPVAQNFSGTWEKVPKLHLNLRSRNPAFCVSLEEAVLRSTRTSCHWQMAHRMQADN